jgi:hypothetical protein
MKHHSGMATLLQNWQGDGPSGAEFFAISYEAVITNGLWLLEYSLAKSASGLR